jgi:hypothetical protein
MCLCFVLFMVNKKNEYARVKMHSLGTYKYNIVHFKDTSIVLFSSFARVNQWYSIAFER